MDKLTPKQKAFLEEAEKFIADSESIPAEYRFPPRSSKFCEGVKIESEWLTPYFIFRQSLEEHRYDVKDVQEYQAKAGKESSLLASRFRGALLGLAICDALGTTAEFKARGTFSPITDIVGGGPFNLKPGQWTDDTSMAFCLAHSLLRKNGFDAKDQMDIYTLWRKKGIFSSTGTCFDIGNTVSNALDQYEKTGDPYAGSDDPRSAGNGSLMRLAPVVLFYFSNPADAIFYSGESSKTTHRAVEAIDSCRYFGALLHGALNGVSKEELLEGIYSPVKDYWNQYPLCENVRNIANGSYKNKTQDEIQSTGYVIHTLEAALWAFYNSQDFKSGALKAVNLGGDADTIGAVYGQIAGAYYGELRIPIEWIIELYYQHVFYLKADDMLKHHNEITCDQD